jgi:hypothetical protein
VLAVEWENEAGYGFHILLCWRRGVMVDVRLTIGRRHRLEFILMVREAGCLLLF